MLTYKIKYYFFIFLIFCISCNNSSIDGHPEPVVLYNFEFHESSLDSMLIKWNKSVESKDDFFSYNFYGSNDSLLENKELIFQRFDQSDTIYTVSNYIPYKYYQIQVINRLTGYNPIYFKSSSNIIYFNIDEWILLWDQFYSIFTTRLDLADSEINYIPDNLEFMENLIRLDLANNMLSGSIPHVIFKLKNLKTLILSNNQLEGFIPYEIDSLRNIETLFLDENFLSGEIPNSFCNMGINFGNPYRFSLENNKFCPPYPLCLESYIGEQDLSDCE